MAWKKASLVEDGWGTDKNADLRCKTIKRETMSYCVSSSNYELLEDRPRTRVQAAGDISN